MGGPPPNIPLPQFQDDPAGTGWRAKANCLGKDTNAWYPDRGVIPFEAFALCSECDVWFGCLSWAVETDEPMGVWGRMRLAERVRYKQDLKAAGIAIGSTVAAAVALNLLREPIPEDSSVGYWPSTDFWDDRPPLETWPLDSGSEQMSFGDGFDVPIVALPVALRWDDDGCVGDSAEPEQLSAF